MPKDDRQITQWPMPTKRKFSTLEKFLAITTIVTVIIMVIGLTILVGLHTCKI